MAACVAQLPAEEADSLRARVIATRDPEELRVLRHSRSRLIILYDGTDIVIEYLWDDEHKSWEADGEPESHIFRHLQRLERWLVEV